jgi:hypothetical protein
MEHFSAFLQTHLLHFVDIVAEYQVTTIEHQLRPLCNSTTTIYQAPFNREIKLSVVIPEILSVCIEFLARRDVERRCPYELVIKL